MRIRDYIKLYVDERVQEAKMKRLVKRPFDYDFLQLLINEVGASGVEVHITTQDGSLVTITKKEIKRPVPKDAWSIDLE